MRIAVSARTENFVLDIRGDDNSVAIAEGAVLNGFSLTVQGDANHVEIGVAVKLKGTATVHNGGALRVGPRSTFERVLLVCSQETVTVGSDCMFAAGVEIRTTDAHPIFDLFSRERINYPKSIRIGDYVWCGKHVFVLKGANVHTGTIVGLGSVVSGELPAFSLAVEAPARVIRTNVTWTRRTRNSVLSEDKTAMDYVQRAWQPDARSHRKPPPPLAALLALLRGSGVRLVGLAMERWRQVGPHKPVDRPPA